MHWRKICLIIRNVQQVNKLDGCPSNSFLTLLIYLQCSDNDLGGGDVSIHVLYEREGRVVLIIIVFSIQLSGILSAIKIVLEAINVQCSGMTILKSLI